MSEPGAASGAQRRWGNHVDDHQRVVAVEQVVGEMHAADPVVDDPHPGSAGRAAAEPANDLGTEAVVAEEDVADAGYQDSRAMSHLSDPCYLRIRVSTSQDADPRSARR